MSGIYEIIFTASITEPAQLVVVLNGVEDLNSISGRSTGTSLVSNSILIQTTIPNSIISINNPSSNSTALTMTIIAGGSLAVSAHLIIKQIS